MTFYTAPKRVAWQAQEAENGLLVYLMPLPAGGPVLLQGVGALIWMAAVEGQDVVSVVAEATGEDAQEIGEVVAGFVRGLVRAGLLRSRTAPPTPDPSAQRDSA